MKKILLLLIKVYRYLISPFLGERCRFYPSCSLYAQIAIERYGALGGTWLVTKRLCKCHPWYRGDSYDPVPEVGPVDLSANPAASYRFSAIRRSQILNRCSATFLENQQPSAQLSEISIGPSRKNNREK